MIRVVFVSDQDAANCLKALSFTGRIGESLDDREYMDHYGFTSRPLPGAQAIAIGEGNLVYVIATEDTRYRPQIASGDACLYDYRGNRIWCEASGISETSPVEISETAPVISETASTSITNAAPEINIEGSATVTVTAPDVNIEGSTEVAITAPQLSLGTTNPADLYKLIDTRIIALFNAHTHPDPQGGNSGIPTQQITLGECNTSLTGAA